MSAYLKFLDATTIFFKSLNYYQDASTTFIKTGQKNRTNICVAKKKGFLEFTLNAKDHFGRKEFNFDINFQGTFLGNDFAGNPRIIWSMTSDFSKNNNSNKFTLTDSNVEVTINGISGSIITTLAELNPITTDQDCFGNNASTEVEMKTNVGENNYIEVSGNGLGIDVTMTFRNIEIISDCRSSVDISSYIRVIRNECGIGGAAPDGVVKFVAIVKDDKVSHITTYAWTVSGGAFKGSKVAASPKGATDKYIFEVQLGDNDDTITVEVVITVTDPATGTILYNKIEKIKNYQPDTEQSIRFKTLACKIKKYTVVNLFVKPLWDPLRDFSIKPGEKKEFDKLNTFAKTILKDLNTLSKLREF